MQRTTPKKKKIWSAHRIPDSPEKGKAIRRTLPGTQQTRKKRTYTSTPGANLNEILRLAKIAKIQGIAKRTRNKRNKTPKKLKEIVSKVIKTLDGVTIKESGPGDVVIKVDTKKGEKRKRKRKRKGGGKKKTKKKTHQKQTKQYKIEIIKKKPLTIQVWDYNTTKKEWEKEGKATQIKKGGRRRKTKKRALKKRTRRRKN